jgi:hypothetical protein
LQDIRRDYEQNFVGMTTEPVALDDLLAVRERMLRELQHGLDNDERQFLLSFVANRPEWHLLGPGHVDKLPGIRWKMQNLQRLENANPKKFAEQSDALARRLA